jgi:protein gp37
MQRTKIEWATHCWNPIKGCLGECTYCYGKKLCKRFPKNFPKDFKPTFYPEELIAPYKLRKRKNIRIFADSISDFFGYGVEPWWQDQILHVIKENPDLSFIVLTKQPQRIETTYKFPKNMWIGVSVDYGSNYDKIDFIRRNKLQHEGVRFVSFEPLLGTCKEELSLEGIDWIIIGAQTNPTKYPEKEWIRKILNEAKYKNIPVFMKNNLKDYWTCSQDSFNLQKYPTVINV